jgi:hypothetical protein
MTIAEAILYLSDRCDGARSLDHRGFNRYDSPFGKSLAQQIRAGRILSPAQIDMALRMLKKYRRQLNH